MKILTLKVSEALFAEISAEAASRNVSRSEVARQRLATRGVAKGESLWDKMKDLVIDDDDLPRDLSTNKKHMKGYGQSRSNR